MRIEAPLARRPVVVVVLCLVVSVSFSCSGGGGDDAAPAATVVAVSFVGFPVVLGGAVPDTFRDEALLIFFSAPLDAESFGGLLTIPGTSAPSVVFAHSAAAASSVPFVPWADQAAARAALQIFDDATGAAVTSGLWGRSLLDPSVLVYDPKVRALNPFGLPFHAGLEANRQFDVFIPEDGGLHSQGRSVASFGAPPAVLPPLFAEDPDISTLFVTGPDFLPDDILPTVVEITTTSLGGTALAGQTIPHDDTIIVRFSEAVDPTSVDVLRNLTVRNLGVTTPQQSSGVLVPVTVTRSIGGATYMLTPAPSFGDGPVQLEVSVGNDPFRPILDLGLNSMGVPNELAGPVTMTCDTIPTTGQGTVSSFIERFESVSLQDVFFTPRYDPAEWNLNSDGLLKAPALSGSASAGPLGSRMQFAITPGFPGPLTPYFSPFDDDGANNLGPGVNPAGGSRTQLLYTQTPGGVELPDDLAASIEFVEWQPAAGTMSAVYDGFSMRMSHTTVDGLQFGSGGLLANLDENFDFDNPQNAWLGPTSHPTGNLLQFTPNESPVTVVPSQAYSVPMTTGFVPFPALSLLFDFDALPDRLELNPATFQFHPPNLLVDIDIPAPVGVTSNFVLGTATQTLPPRRALAGSGDATAAVLDDAIYHMRITVVPRHSSARSVFYDLGVPTASSELSNLVLVLPPGGPEGVVTVSLEGATAVFGNVIAAGGSGLHEVIDRNGQLVPAGLDAVEGRRFVRALFRFEADAPTNTSPAVDGFILGLVQ